MNRNNDSMNGLPHHQTRGSIVVLCKFVSYIVMFPFSSVNKTTEYSTAIYHRKQ